MPVIRILPHAELCPQGDTIEAPTGTEEFAARRMNAGIRAALAGQDINAL